MGCNNNENGLIKIKTQIEEKVFKKQKILHLCLKVSIGKIVGMMLKYARRKLFFIEGGNLWYYIIKFFTLEDKLI